MTRIGAIPKTWIMNRITKKYAMSCKALSDELTRSSSLGIPFQFPAWNSASALWMAGSLYGVSPEKQEWSQVPKPGRQRNSPSKSLFPFRNAYGQNQTSPGFRSRRHDYRAVRFPGASEGTSVSGLHATLLNRIVQLQPKSECQFCGFSFKRALTFKITLSNFLVPNRACWWYEVKNSHKDKLITTES